MRTEVKTAGFAVVKAEPGVEDGWVVAGYGSTFNGIDAVGDMITPGAYKDSLQARPEVPILWQHQADQPIGRTLFMAEDDHGLLFKARLLPTRQGKDAQILVRGGALSGVSIGYDAVSSRPGRNGVIRHLDQIDLYELSLVTWPADDNARLQPAVKALNDALLIAEVDARRAKGFPVGDKTMAKYAAACKRNIERLQYGKTWQEYSRDLLKQIAILQR